MGKEITVWPASTCGECGKLIPAGRQQRCEKGGYCSWHIPAAVHNRMVEMWKIVGYIGELSHPLTDSMSSEGKLQRIDGLCRAALSNPETAEEAYVRTAVQH